jgi:hypothetical protein
LRRDGDEDDTADAAAGNGASAVEAPALREGARLRTE